MTKEERLFRLSFARNQFEISKMYAAYWQAMATTGVAARRDRARGRKATEEETAEGLTMGWEKCTPEENTKEALDTMLRHIDHMRECNETIDSLMRGEEPGR